MGTDALSPQRPKSFRHLLLLPPAPAVYDESSRRIFESALERVRRSSGFRSTGMWSCRNMFTFCSANRNPAVVRSSLSLDCVGIPAGLLPSKPYFGRCAQVVEARSIAAFDRRRGAFLAKAVLRFQHSKLPAVCGKAALYSSQPGEGWVVRTSGGLGVEQFSHYATGSEGRVEIESEWTARKRERAAGRLCPAVELPHSSQNTA